MPFDRPEHAIGDGQNDAEFNKDETCKLTAMTPKPANPLTSPGVVVQYHLHRHGQDATILAGSSVLSRESVCPPFESCPNKNLFQQFFGIEFHHDDHTYIHAISTYEFSRWFWAGGQYSVSVVSRKIQIWIGCGNARSHIVLDIRPSSLPSCVPA